MLDVSTEKEKIREITQFRTFAVDVGQLKLWIVKFKKGKRKKNEIAKMVSTSFHLRSNDSLQPLLLWCFNRPRSRFWIQFGFLTWDVAEGFCWGSSKAQFTRKRLIFSWKVCWFFKMFYKPLNVVRLTICSDFVYSIFRLNSVIKNMQCQSDHIKRLTVHLTDIKGVIYYTVRNSKQKV